MVASIAAGTSSQYYLNCTQYYLGGIEPDGIWLRDGGLGVPVGETVEASLFENLHAACDADDHPLLANDGGRTDQVGGYDATFSAPKTVSIAWALANPERKRLIEAAQREAVAEAIEMLSRYAAFCRRGRGGQILEKVELTVAAFQHGEARPAEHSDGDVFADFALHTHTDILNLGLRGDGSYGRLDGRLLFAFKMAAGAYYHKGLAQRLRGLGFGIEITGKNGMFEIVGIDPELTAYFSARRHEITSELAELGLDSASAPALAAAKTLTTRRAKTETTDKDRHQLWAEKVKELGFDPGTIVDAALEAGREQGQFKALDDSELDEGLRGVLAGLTETASTFEYRHLLAGVAAFLTAHETDISIDAAVERAFAQDLTVALAHDRWGHAICSTPESIALEQGLFDRASRMANLMVPAPAEVDVNAALEFSILNPEQIEAARIACRGNVLSLIEGGPGVGKTTLLSSVAQLWQQDGWQVIGASTAWKIANQLRDELNIESRAIDSWLARDANGQPFLNDKTLLIVDESGLITSKQMDAILQAVEAARATGKQVAVRMVGDRRQLQPIGGPGLRIVTDAIGTQRVDAIVRQRQEWARDMVSAFGRGDAGTALKALVDRGHFHEQKGDVEATKSLVAAWDQFRSENSNRASLMIARTNKQVQAINEQARKVLRARHELGAADVCYLDAATPSGQQYTLALAAGEQVRFLARNDELGVINGTTGKLLDVTSDATGQAMLRVEVERQIISFSPSDLADDQGRAQLAHAYATTCYGAQGLTTDQSFLFADAAMNRHDIFVAASRHRDGLEVFADAKELDGRAKAARLLSDRERPVEQDERHTVLAQALSRSGMRASTLDYLAPRDIENARAIEQTVGERKPQRQQSRGVSHEL